MILIFGGTTQGRIAARVCDGASKPFFYSTKSGEQRVEAANITLLSGGMTSGDIIDFCQQNNIELVIDAAHPFASVLHQNIMDATKELGIRVIRFERKATQRANGSRVRYSETIEKAIEYIKIKDYQRVLALTGVKSSGLLAPMCLDREVCLRIMDREESWKILGESGFPTSKTVLYDTESDEALFTDFKPDVVLIKESGSSGGVEQKMKLCEQLAIDLVIVERPKLPDYETVVYGEDGLRLAIDRTTPHFFGLSTGLTTGSCATAATVAALRAILSGEVCQNCQFTLPSGESIIMEVAKLEHKGNWAKATVIKDAGDDPDVTHRAEICAEVTINKDSSGITIKGGEGVGVVTLPGLGLEVGESAINPIPRKMLKENVTKEIQRAARDSEGVDLVITVPQGKELAKRTFNGRLGIEGGISILGTSGIVYPFSKEAFLDSIQRHINLIQALGYNKVVINSGGKSERFLKNHFTNHDPKVFVQYGNMIGDTLKLCREAHIEEVTLGVMIGKAVKLANGNLDTHSRSGVMDLKFIEDVAKEVPCSDETVRQIQEITTARQLWEIIAQAEQKPFFDRLKELCYKHCTKIINRSRLKIILVRDDGKLF
ncbi:MAG: cobalt-precorrin-5B (C(1))-methyltransferase CbiD [Rikenellaceae bacterium]